MDSVKQKPNSLLAPNKERSKIIAQLRITSKKPRRPNKQQKLAPVREVDIFMYMTPIDIVYDESKDHNYKLQNFQDREIVIEQQVPIDFEWPKSFMASLEEEAQHISPDDSKIMKELPWATTKKRLKKKREKSEEWLWECPKCKEKVTLVSKCPADKYGRGHMNIV